MELTPYSAKGMRPLSRFHAREMLYEYALGLLDEKRRQALEEYLKTDPDMLSELDRIRNGVNYLEQLSALQVPNDSLEKVRSSSNFADRLVETLRVDDWPPGLRLGLESAAVVSMIFVIAVMVPWNMIFQSIQDDSSGLTLAEIRRDFRVGSESETENIAENRSLMETVKGVVFDDEGVPTVDSKTDDSAKVAATKSEEKTEATVAVAENPKAPAVAQNEAPAVVPAPAPVAKTQAPVTVTATTAANGVNEQKAAARTVAEASKDSVAEASKDSVAGPGVLYRGKLKTTNVEATTPKLVEFLNQAGGRKAGQVPLGWVKDKGSYFHFTIPEAKLGELEAFFRDYGTLAISKERHERVMPEGIIRLIIDVEEKTPEP